MKENKFMKLKSSALKTRMFLSFFVPTILLMTVSCEKGQSPFNPTKMPLPLGSRNTISLTLDLTEIWRFRTGTPNTDSIDIQTPPFVFLTKDKVVIGSHVDNEQNNANDSVLTALSLNAGKILWQTRYGNPGFGTNIYSAYLNNNTNRLFLLYSFNVAAFDLETGQQLWITPDLGEHTDYTFSYEQDNALLVNTSKGEKITIDPSSGQVLSRGKTSQSWWMTIPRGNITLVDGQSGFMALDQNNQILWTWHDERRHAKHWPSFINDNDLIAEFGGPGYYLARINYHTGQEVWKSTFDMISNYALLGSQVFALREDGALVALDLETGNVVGLLQFDKEFGPAVGKVPFWVATMDTYLFTYFGDTQELVAFKLIK